MFSVVREINQEYEARVEALKTGTTHDALSLSDSRATWPEVLAVYAVKSTSDQTNGLEVVTIQNSLLTRKVEWILPKGEGFTLKFSVSRFLLTMRPHRPPAQTHRNS